MGTAYKCCFIFKSRRHFRPPPKDVRDLFILHAGGAPHMDGDGLRRYLAASQGEGLDDDDGTNNVERLLEQIRGTRRRSPRIPRHQQLVFTLDDFHRILFSPDLNPPLRHHQQRIHHDMTLPLSHYFIYASRSGGEHIIRELKMGVRAIEVAMWPNSKKDDIEIIHHNWTLAECFKSIKEHAFVASPYPVIITLEDNLQSSNLQKKAAKVVLDVLGDILYWPHTDHVDVRGNADSNNPLKEFPSPEELKGRVLLLSTKLPPASPIIKKEDVKMHDGHDEDQKEQKMQPPKYPPYRHLITIRPEKQEAIERVYEYPPPYRLRTLENEPFPRFDPKKKPFDQTKSIEKLKLVDALHSEPGKVMLLNCSMEQIEKAAMDRGTDIVRFTQRNILRIYPISYGDPFDGWVHGAQMVTLDMQEYGRALWLMPGFYRANGGCGYVRKPDILMQTMPEVFDPRKPQPVKTSLKVKVYKGDGWLTDFKHAHTSFIPDLWTSVGIAGVPADTTAMKNTKATENTWAPVWEDEFSFDLTVPEIALLRVEVHQYDASEKDVFGGQTVLPVSELRPGIRAVPLFDRQGNRFDNVRLLMRFQFA